MIKILEEANDNLKIKFEDAAEEFNEYLSVIDDVFEIFMKMIEFVSKEDLENDLEELKFPNVKLYNSEFSKNVIKNMLPENPTDKDYQKAIDKCNSIIEQIKKYWKELDNLK